MIQDIAPKVFKNQFKNPAPRPGDTAFVFNGQDLMISGSTESGISFPKVSDFIRDEEAEFIYLFEISGKNYFLVGTCLAYEDELCDKVRDAFNTLAEIFGVKLDEDKLEDSVSEVRDEVLDRFEKMTNGEVIFGSDSY